MSDAAQTSELSTVCIYCVTHASICVVLFMQLLMELLQVWGDKSFLNHTSYEQHHYLTQALILCMAHITEQQTQEHKDGRELLSPNCF